MQTISYISVKRFFQKVFVLFKEYSSGRTAWFSPLKEADFPEKEADSPDIKFRVSLHDLKIISSSLLYFKKYLLKKEDITKAKLVDDLDRRLYQLILELEKTREEDYKQTSVAA